MINLETICPNCEGQGIVTTDEIDYVCANCDESGTEPLMRNAIDCGNCQEIHPKDFNCDTK